MWFYLPGTSTHHEYYSEDKAITLSTWPPTLNDKQISVWSKWKSRTLPTNQIHVSHYQRQIPTRLISFIAARRPVTDQLGFVILLGTVDRHTLDSQESSNQPKVKSSAHQMTGSPSACASTVIEVMSSKPENETGVNEQFIASRQAGTLDVCDVTLVTVCFSRSYLKPLKVNKQGASLESQPRSTLVKLNEKQSRSCWGPTLISAISGATPGWAVLEMEEGVNWTMLSPDEGLKRVARGERIVKPPE